MIVLRMARDAIADPLVRRLSALETEHHAELEMYGDFYKDSFRCASTEMLIALYRLWLALLRVDLDTRAD